MSRSLLADAFEHHVWATLRLLDACLALSPDQVDTAVPGTNRPILETIRHLVWSDSFYLFIARGARTPLIHEYHVGLPELRAAMERTGAGWSRLFAEDLDPDTVLREVDPEDGYQRDAPLGIRLAQALHHGNDHRSQVCTALTVLGMEPPDLSVWEFGLQQGCIVEVWPTS